MTEFKHSVVLFSGEDGLPLEFNIINTIEKVILKAMIEHGGGLCTLNDNAINLVSPGTKAFNFDFQKRFLSTKYIFDCVEKNYLLNMLDYEIKITELETSDISDDSGNTKSSVHFKDKTLDKKNAIEFPEISSDGDSLERSKNKIVCSNVCSQDFQPAKLALFSSTPSVLPSEICPKKTVEMEPINEEPSLLLNIEEYTNSFQNSENEFNISMGTARKMHKKRISISIENPSSSEHHIEEYSSTQSDLITKSSPQQIKSIYKQLSTSKENEQREKSDLLKEDVSDKTVSDLQEAMEVCDVEDLDIVKADKVLTIEQSLENIYLQNVSNNEKVAEVIVEAVSSSQPQNDDLDEFDLAVMKKSKIAVDENEDDSLSQSYTVSSSADAQIASKPNSSAEIFDSNVTPDPELNQQNSQSTARILYIQELEKEIEQILSKPSPKSIEDKMCLIKYICCVKRLPPAEVLQQLLQNI